MNVYAKIENGVVTNVALAQSADQLPSATWIDVTNAVPRPAPGWTHNGTTFAPPGDPPLPQVRVQQALALHQAAQASSSTYHGFDITTRSPTEQITLMMMSGDWTKLQTHMQQVANASTAAQVRGITW